MALTKQELLLLAKKAGIKNASKLTKVKLAEILNSKTPYETLKKNDGKNIKYIYHTADLHIRPLDRHDEYAIVFQNLYDFLKDQNNLNDSVFVICGDIFHARDRLLSETLILFNNFIEKITSIIDVICILGNHDTFTHMNRLDTLSGISDIKTFNNFYFLKASGIYVYKNLCFAVSSLLDNHFISSEFEINDGYIKIALYHGAITGSKINEFYDVPDTVDNIKISDFKGFDLVLLGDIHKRQHLKDNIAYPGSLIQQNHSEDTCKGLLKWDTETLKSEFIPITNPYQFVTITSEDYKLKKYPEFSRIRHFISYKEGENKTDQDELLKFLNTVTKVISYTKELRTNKSLKLIKKDDKNLPMVSTFSKEELVSVYFNKLLEEQTTDIEIMNKVKNIHNEYVTDNISKTKQNQSTCWRLNKLEFKNVFSYGDDYLNTISFKDNEIIGVLGNNAIGKTSILNTIIYCLFGNNYKGVNTSSRNIINKNSKSFYIKLVIHKDPDDVFVIIREGKNKARKGGIKGMDENVKIFLNENELTDSTKNITIQKIQDILCCNKDTFLLTNLMSYTLNSSLLNMSSSDISNIFNNLFDTVYIKDIYNNVLKKYKHLVSELKIKTSELASIKSYLSDNDIIQKQLDDNFKKSKDIEEILKLLNKEIDDLSEKTTNISCIYTEEEYNRAVSFIKSQDPIDLELDMSIDILQHHMKSLKKYLLLPAIQCNKTEEEINKEIKDLECKLKRVDEGTGTEIHKKQYETLKTVGKYRNYDNSHTQKLINDFKKVKGEKIDENLFTDVLEYIKDTSDENYIKNKYHIMTFENNQKDIIYNTSINNKITYLQKQLNDVYQQLYYLYQDSVLYITSKNIVDEYIKYTDSKDSINIKNTVVLKKNSYVKELNVLIKQQGILETKIDINNKYKIRISQLEIDINDMNDFINIYEIYKNIMNPKALPKLLLVDTIKKVELFCNTFIYNQIGMYVNLNTIEEDDSKWEITFQRGDMILGGEHLSGFEKFVVNLGLKTALDKYKFYNSGKIFFIDEVFDCISEENWEKIPSILSYIKEHYNTLILISHNEKLKTNVSRVLKFEKLNFNNTRVIDI